jgi:hypothetical protein
MKPFFSALGMALLLFTGGCANPGVVQMSPGIYELARADHGGIFGNKDALKASVIRDANSYAESLGKVAVPVSAKEHPVGIMGDWASYEYVFKIVDKESPDARTPTILVRSDSVREGGATSLGSLDTLYVAQSAMAIGTNPPASPGAQAPGKSTADRLIELKKLFDAGVITKEDYDEKRKALVDQL